MNGADHAATDDADTACPTSGRDYSLLWLVFLLQVGILLQR